ncbi:MAG: PKD domain-containing protein [Vicinamibacteria bacterium]|nr:PKD domain-containing protein [Vicinamibacteria bacterium]
MTRKMAALTLACGLTLQGCGLDKVKVPESLTGPSELGISLRMLVLPDALVADGIQTAAIQAVLQDQNGNRVSGRGIIFSIMDEAGRAAEIGQLTSASGARVFGSTTIPTNANGIAQVIYTTPERRDFTANARILIGARPVGSDAQGVPFWTVTLELLSAEPRRFPESPGNASPVCDFSYAPNNPVATEGTVLRFFSTSNDTDGYIVRYEWYFGDGTSATGAEGHIDIQKGYPLAGNYTVTHIVTDNVGAQTSCSKPIKIVP